MYMGFDYKYPYTDLTDLNLDWVIEKMKYLLEEYQVIMDWINNDAENYNNLLGRVITLEGQTRSLQNQIIAEIEHHNEDILRVYQDMNAQYSRITAETNNKFNAVMTEIQSMITSVYVDINRIRNDLVNQIIAGDEATLSYVRAELQTFVDNLPDYENLIIHNPVTGTMTNVETAINDVYNSFNIYALTADEYDALDLTADEYDSIGLTAYEYDHYGKNHLSVDSAFMMRDPFTGDLVEVKEVVYKLADLHRVRALTATEYDALDLTADDYDALDLTAYDYDYYGVTP